MKTDVVQITAENAACLSDVVSAALEQGLQTGDTLESFYFDVKIEKDFSGIGGSEEVEECRKNINKALADQLSVWRVASLQKCAELSTVRCYACIADFGETLYGT